MPKHMNSLKLYFSDKEVGERYGVGRAAIWRWVAEGRFPAPVKIGPRATRWRLSDLETFEAKLGKNAA